MSLGCKSILGDCYADDITHRFIFWKDVLNFGYFGIVVLSVCQLVVQAVRWALGRWEAD